MGKKVVLAYSGGLDTSVAVRWMTEEWGCEIIALAADVGQGEDLEPVRQRALTAGAIEAHVADLRSEFAAEFLAPAIAANALYENRYPLISSLTRPVIVRRLVQVAQEMGADAIAHGCTGKGNDQLRFEVAARALAPDIEILAPVREWGLSRSDSIDYAAKHDIPVTVRADNPYSIDQNLWGRAIECGVLEDPWRQPPEEIYAQTRVSATEAFEVTVGFEQGRPVTIDGEHLPLDQLVQRLTALIGPTGWGRIDMVENRRVGIKTREIYEAPAALALIAAHRDLEGLTLERDVAHEKVRLEPRWTEIVYDGYWFSPLREAFDAFIASTQRWVTGEVRLLCAPGRCDIVGRRSPNALYQHDLATYDAEDSFRHQDAAGFVRLWGLSTEMWAKKQRSS
ncbi:MAG TPA: argininosuccinate synthase [Acidimicrobiales bacterium]|nr:argininosuccinate synthase [Acidimicrobiales bacterium]